jgi:uncharacterized protein DUF3160
MRNLLLAVCLAGLWGCSGSTAISDPLALDLAQVQGMEHYEGPESGKKLLEDNGFVVVKNFERRVFVPYFNEDLPHFVTADSVLQTYHVIFEDELKGLEAALADEVLALTRDMRKALAKYDLSGGAADQEEALQLARDTFLVAEALLASEDEAPVAEGRAAEELARIRAVSGVSQSPLFGYDMDYTQFKPRSFYVETPVLRRYFRAIKWYGSAGFRQKSPLETQAALVIAHCYVNTPDLKARWDKVNRIYTQLIAPCDDLTPQEYSAFCEDSVPAQPDPAIRTLRNPRINGMVLSPAEMEDWVPLVKGMRFLGFRYMPDSEAFMALTHPKVPGRALPSGLEVLAANGSKRAGELARKTAGAAGPAYEKGLETAGRVLSTFRKDQPDSQYARFLEVVEALGEDAPRKAPAFAKTSAYADKNTMTGLAAWACMRHSLVLHAKDSTIAMGMRTSKELKGYVEPNPRFFKTMLALTDNAIALFESVGVGKGSRLQGKGGLRSLVERLAAMVDKELAGKPFSDGEIRLLDGYAYRIADLQGFETNSPHIRDLPWLAPIADVHTALDPLGQNLCLEVAMGASMPIYVIVEHEGVRHLLIGAVSSYCEFAQPISQRMTDQEWQARWDSDRKPALPGWTASFVASAVADLDQDALVSRLQKGEKVEEIFLVDDPRIDQFLRTAAQPGSEFDGTEHYGWILAAAARKLGREMAPMLYEIMWTGTTDRMEQAEGGRWRDIPGTANQAARALGRILVQEDYGKLMEFVRDPDEDRARLFYYAIGRVQGKEYVAFLVRVLEESQRKDDRSVCVFRLGREASKDVTSVLLRLFVDGDADLKADILEALGEIWAAEPHGATRPVCEAGEAQLKEWREKIRDLVLASLAEAEQNPSDAQTFSEMRARIRIPEAAIRAAAHIRLAEAVPGLVKIITSPQEEDGMGSHGRERALWALGRIGTTEAMEALARIAIVGGADTRHAALRTLQHCPEVMKAAPYLAGLLSDRTTVRKQHLRTCDCAALLLASIYPDGPGDISRKTKDKDALVEKWKVYMAKVLPAAE